MVVSCPKCQFQQTSATHWIIIQVNWTLTLLGIDKSIHRTATEWATRESMPGTGRNFHLCRHVQAAGDSTWPCQLHATVYNLSAAPNYSTECSDWLLQVNCELYWICCCLTDYTGVLFCPPFYVMRKLVSQAKKIIWEEVVAFRSESRHQLLTKATHSGSQLRWLFDSYSLTCRLKGTNN
jgi:hypothetical protein